MTRQNMRSTAVAAAFATFVVAAGVSAQPARTEEHNPARRAPSAAAELGEPPGIIVKFRSSAAPETHAGAGRGRPRQQACGAWLRDTRVACAGRRFARAEGRAAAGRVVRGSARARARDADVEFAEPDVRRYPHALPNDPLYAGQWYLQNAPMRRARFTRKAAWDRAPATQGVVVAVLDTGVLFDHPDLKRAHLGGRLLPGYDFIANAAAANDGDGRDADASDRVTGSRSRKRTKADSPAAT